MEKAKEYLRVSDDVSDIISRLKVPAHRVGKDSSFFEDVVLNGIRVDRIDHDSVSSLIWGLNLSLVQNQNRPEKMKTQLNREKRKSRRDMEKAKEYLRVSDDVSDMISRLKVPAHRVGKDSSFFEDVVLNGIRVDRVEPGLVQATFKVPPRLTDRTGKMASGAIANLVDMGGWAVVFVDGLPISYSVDMSISFLAPAKAHDELEITSRILGQKGGYSGTIVLIRNKATGEVVAEGRHSLFGNKPSKL